MTAKQETAAAVVVPEKPKDYVSMQLEAMGEVVRSNLNARQQFECLHEMQGVLYRHMHQQQQQQLQTQPQPQQQQQAAGNYYPGGFQELLYKDL